MCRTRKIPLIEDQDEVRGLVPEAFEHISMTARKEPDIAGFEVVCFGMPVGFNDRHANSFFDDKPPFGRRGVPVKLSHRPRFESHRNASKALRTGQLHHGHFFAGTVSDDFAGLFLHRKFECRKFLATESRIRNVVQESGISRLDCINKRRLSVRNGDCRSCGSKSCSTQEISAMKCRHREFLVNFRNRKQGRGEPLAKADNADSHPEMTVTTSGAPTNIQPGFGQTQANAMPTVLRIRQRRCICIWESVDLYESVAQKRLVNITMVYQGPGSHLEGDASFEVTFCPIGTTSTRTGGM
jgi:hypothetical protein